MQFIAAWAFEFLSSLAKRLPPRLKYRFVRGLGLLWSVLPHQQKKALIFNVRSLLKWDERSLRDLVPTVFQNFAVTLYDFFAPEGIVLDVPGREMLETLRRQRGGLLVLTFHVGYWELGAQAMRSWGWPVTAVYQPYKNKAFARAIEKRRAEGVNFLRVGERAAQGVREALRRGDVVAMLGDHPFGEEGTFVDILGEKVKWPKGPVVLAVREKVPILVGTIIRTAPLQYKAIIEDPLIPRARTKQEVNRLVQEVANKFGELVRKYPTQWYRFRPLEMAKNQRERTQRCR